MLPELENPTESTHHLGVELDATAQVLEVASQDKLPVPFALSAEVTNLYKLSDVAPVSEKIVVPPVQRVTLVVAYSFACPI